MIQIAICDDQRSTTEDLETLLPTYANEKMLDINITYFSSPSILYSHMKQTTMDIIFMDLDFGSEAEDGILWSTRIHQDFPQTLVLILTAYEKRYKEGFVAKAFRFMAKPLSKKELYSNLDACLEELNLYKVVILTRHGVTQKIPTKDILYFAARKGGSDLKTVQTSLSCDKYLMQWEYQMPSSIFFRCHKKYLVNFNAIKQIKNHIILLSNGEKLPVSRRKLTLLKAAFMKFDIAMKGRETEEPPI